MLSAPGVESGEFLRSEIAQCAVWAHAVVVLAPCFDLAPRVVERNENLFVEAFLTQASVETFDEGVLDGLARLDELDPHTAFVSPSIKRTTGKLRTVVSLNHRRQSAADHAQALQHSGYPLSCQ